MQIFNRIVVKNLAISFFCSNFARLFVGLMINTDTNGVHK